MLTDDSQTNSFLCMRAGALFKCRTFYTQKIPPPHTHTNTQMSWYAYMPKVRFPSSTHRWGWPCAVIEVTPIELLCLQQVTHTQPWSTKSCWKSRKREPMPCQSTTKKLSKQNYLHLRIQQGECRNECVSLQTSSLIAHKYILLYGAWGYYSTVQ